MSFSKISLPTSISACSSKFCGSKLDLDVDVNLDLDLDLEPNDDLNDDLNLNISSASARCSSIFALASFGVVTPHI